MVDKRPVLTCKLSHHELGHFVEISFPLRLLDGLDGETKVSEGAIFAVVLENLIGEVGYPLPLFMGLRQLVGDSNWAFGGHKQVAEAAWHSNYV